MTPPSLLDDWGGGDHWLPLNKATSAPRQLRHPTGVVGGFGVIPSDYSSMFEIVLSTTTKHVLISIISSDLPNFTHFFMAKLNLQNPQNE